MTPATKNKNNRRKPNTTLPLLSRPETAEHLGGFAGGVVGALAGLAVTGSTGALVGASVTWGMATVYKLAADAARTAMVDSQCRRIDRTAMAVVTGLTTQIESGHVPRDDGFFGEINSRSDAEELLEGVFLKVRDEYEERKVPLCANLFVSTAFRRDVSSGDANHLLSIFDRLSYRQLCIMALVSRCTEAERKAFYSDYLTQISPSLPVETIHVFQEAFELYSEGLIVCGDDSGYGTAEPNKCSSLLEWSTITPATMRQTKLGKQFSELFGLSEISEENLTPLRSQFALDNVS